jgi:DegV family protein with EDD domain
VTVGVVTDSAASLGPDLAAAWNVVVVPMQLSVGDDSLGEDEITLEEVAARLDEGVSTSAPSPGAFARAIEQADRGDGVLVVTVSEKLSATAGSARMGGDLGGAEVRVLDSGSAAGGQGLVVLAAARAAAGGARLAEVEQRAREVAGRTRLIAAVDSLDQLERGGRIPRMAAMAGRGMGIRPLFELRHGEIKRLRPATSVSGAQSAMLSRWRRSRPEHAKLHLAALHCFSRQRADQIVVAVSAHSSLEECFIGQFSPVMVAHTGPGVWGMAWWWEDPPGKAAR